MNRKITYIICFYVIVVLLLPAGFASSSTSDERQLNEIMKEIKNIDNKILTVDKVIGNVHVRYWEHVVNGFYVIGDYILLHTNLNDDSLIEYKNNWRDDNYLSNLNNDFSFESNDCFWTHPVVFLDEEDCGYFYNFYDTFIISFVLNFIGISGKYRNMTTEILLSYFSHLC